MTLLLRFLLGLSGLGLCKTIRFCWQLALLLQGLLGLWWWGRLGSVYRGRWRTGLLLPFLSKRWAQRGLRMFGVIGRTRERRVLWGGSWWGWCRRLCVLLFVLSLRRRWSFTFLTGRVIFWRRGWLEAYFRTLRFVMWILFFRQFILPPVFFTCSWCKDN